VTVSSMGEGHPEPIHLQAQYVADGLVRVVRGSEAIVESTSSDYVKDALKALKMMGHHPDSSVVIWSICGNTAFTGALKHT
jgi:hypothetical protein